MFFLLKNKAIDLQVILENPSTVKILNIGTCMSEQTV